MSVVGRKDGEKRAGTYLDLHSFAAAAAAAVAPPSTSEVDGETTTFNGRRCRPYLAYRF